jgi:hypothetical protein
VGIGAPVALGLLGVPNVLPGLWFCGIFADFDFM